jgi:branched-chain amino acid transport system ATP-binding protein
MMLRVDQLQTFYGESQALFGMSLEVGEAEVVTLLGRNGMGKTTTINSIMGIVPARSGQVEFRSHDITPMPPYRVAKLGIGLVPEGRQIFPNLTVRENLEATAANRQKHSNPWNIERVLQMFPALAERLSSMGNLLSGGEQQMLAIGRALMTNPVLLILDDATEGLAPLVRREIWDCLANIKQQGLSILLVDKNINDLLALSDRHYIIEKGAVVWSGNSDQLRQGPQLRERYLGV